MSANKKIFFSSSLSIALVLLIFLSSNCRVSYGLRDISIPDSIKTVKVNFIENRARYINPVLSPALTDKLRQKIVGQTRLVQTNADNADWEVSGYVNDYSVSTSGVTQQAPSINRLNVSVHITLLKRKGNDQQEFDVSHAFDFAASKTLQTAEAELSDDIIRDMTDEIFNHLFSNW
jgi:hypothetical protein